MNKWVPVSYVKLSMAKIKGVAVHLNYLISKNNGHSFQ